MCGVIGRGRLTFNVGAELLPTVIQDEAKALPSMVKASVEPRESAITKQRGPRGWIAEG